MTDQQLIRLLKEDSENGVLEILKLYGGAIRKICSVILRDQPKEDIEEAVSDALFSIWKSKDNFKEEKGISFKSYCYGITRKTALTKRKNVIEAERLIPLEEDILTLDNSFTGELEKKEEEKLLHQEIGKMGEPERSVFILRYFYFFRVKEIALRLQLSDKKVENCLYRGKKQLKTALIQRGIER